jgi:hypothetical protein
MKIILSGVMIRFSDYHKEVPLEADDVKTALDALVMRFPRLKQPLFTPEGTLRTTHRLFVNGQALPTEGNPALHGEDVLEILTAVAGG